MAPRADGKSCLPYRMEGSYDLEMRQSDEPAGDLAILGARITRAREGKGLTKTDVARQLGVRIATVGDWERGKFAPRGDSLRRLAEVLGMTADELVDITEGKDPPFEAWATFVARHELDEDERRFLRTMQWGDATPSVVTYDMALALYRNARQR